MKRFFRFISVIVLFICGEVRAQVYTYHSFPDSNIVWQGYSSCLSGVWYLERWVLKDTMVNGYTYHLIGNSVSPSGMVREDSVRRVYSMNFYPYYDTIEKLLYNFSFSIGDTIKVPSQTLAVYKIDTPVYAGVPRRTIYLADSLGYTLDRWIEGIGSYWGPFGRYGKPSGQCGYSVLCYALQDSSIIYQRENDAFSDYCIHFNAVAKIIDDNVISLSPNPATSSFTLQLSNQPTASTTLLLYDALGKELKREPITTATTTIQRGNLPSGIYFWQLLSEGKITGRGKLVLE